MHKPKAPPLDGYYTVRDGLRLHYLDYPGPIERPAVLCLPGLTRNARDFDAFAERLSPRFRVLALDFRGRGLSEPDPEPGRYLPPTYAHDVIALLDHVGVADAVFVGTSLGGIVAMLVAVIDEDRIAGAILNDVGPELSDKGLERIRGYVGSGRDFATWGEAAQAVASNQGGLPAHWGEAEWEAMARRMCREEEGRIRFDYDPAIAEPFRDASGKPAVDMWPLFDALTAHPVLVVRGKKSDLFPAEAMQRMVERNPNVIGVTVPHAGHAPDLDEPEAVAAIDQFLEQFEG